LELELAAVIDDTPSISLWQSPVASFVKAIESANVFRAIHSLPGERPGIVTRAA
jgi:hypothetical protein